MRSRSSGADSTELDNGALPVALDADTDTAEPRAARDRFLHSCGFEVGPIRPISDPARTVRRDR
jgi:hypothetical protein